MVEGAGERAREILGGFPFDAVLCHGVLPYLEDPYPLIQSLASVDRPGAVISCSPRTPTLWPCVPPSKGATRTLWPRSTRTGPWVAWAR